MYIKLLFPIILLMFSCFAFAQEGARSSRGNSFNAGVKAGLSISQIDGDGWGGFNKLGPHGGFFVNRRLSNKIDGQLEITYTNRGSRVWPTAKNNNYTYRISLHYLDIPLLAKFWIWKLQFEAGIINGIFFGGKESDAFGEVSSGTYRYPSWNRYEMALGLGVNIPISDKLFFNARFHRSILPAVSNGFEPRPGFTFGGLVGSYHRSVLFSLNYQFLD